MTPFFIRKKWNQNSKFLVYQLSWYTFSLVHSSFGGSSLVSSTSKQKVHDWWKKNHWVNWSSNNNITYFIGEGIWKVRWTRNTKPYSQNGISLQSFINTIFLVQHLCGPIMTQFWPNFDFYTPIPPPHPLSGQVIYKLHCHYQNFSPLANGLYLIATTNKTPLRNGNCPIMDPITEMAVDISWGINILHILSTLYHVTRHVLFTDPLPPLLVHVYMECHLNAT